MTHNGIRTERWESEKSAGQPDSPDWVSTQTPDDLAAEGDAQGEAMEELAAAEQPEMGGADPDAEAMLEGGQIP